MAGAVGGLGPLAGAVDPHVHLVTWDMAHAMCQCTKLPHGAAAALCTGGIFKTLLIAVTAGIQPTSVL